jgi:hypothetical protein
MENENFGKGTNLFNIEGIDFQFDEEGFVPLGDVARSLLNQQSQYTGRYIDGAMGGISKPRRRFEIQRRFR